MSGPSAGSVAASLAALGDRDGAKLRFQLLFFVNFVAFSGFVVFRNVYLEEIGLSGTAMGQIGFLLLAGGVAVQPLWGLLSDYLQADRTILVLGAIVSAIGLLAYPAAARLETPFLLIAVGTVVYSAFRAPIIPIATSMVLDRGLDYGAVRAFGSLAFAIGSLGIGFVVAAFGSVAIVYVYVLGAGAIVLITATLPGNAATSEADEDDDPGVELRPALRALLTSRTFLVVLAASFLLRLSALGGEAFFSVYMRNLEVSLALGPWRLGPDGMTGAAWALNSGIEALAFVYALRSSLSHKWLLVVGGGLVTLPNLVYGLTTVPLVLLAIQLAGGVGFAMASVAAVDLAHAAAADRLSSTAQTVLDAVGYGLGGAAGQIVAGGLLDAVGLQSMYVAIAVVGFLGAAIAVLVGDVRVDADGSAA